MPPLPPSITQALGWTLLHSLWQAALIAFALAFGLWLLRNHSSNLRYLLSCCALGFCLIIPALTYGFVFRPGTGDAMSVSDHVTEFNLLNSPFACSPPPQPRGNPSLPTQLRSSVETLKLEPLMTSLPYLVVSWLVGVSVLSLRLIMLFLHAERFKRRQRRSAPAAVQTILAALHDKLGVRQVVTALESSLADSPLVIGVLRPAILIPTSAITGLTMQQLESILAHELAHIKRYDYLVNLFQHVAEILLFYHPSAWWVSRQIRIEREYACDDLVVGATGSALTYARALAQLEALRQPKLALAANGGCLKERIRRIFARKPHVGASSWLAGLSTLMTVLALSLALSLPQWAEALARAAQPRPQLWATMFGLTVRLNEDATALEKVPNSGYVTLEERAGGQRRKMTVTQARSGEFLYTYELNGGLQEVSEEALLWYQDAFARSIGYIYQNTPGDISQLSYRSYIRDGVFHSFAHVYQKHQFYEVMGAGSRRGEVLYDGDLLTPDDPRFELYAEESVLNDIGRMTHLAAHDLLSYLPEMGDTLTAAFVHDVLAHFAPTRKLSYALLDLAAEIQTDKNKAEVLLELVPHLPQDTRLAESYYAVANTLADETLKATILNALPCASRGCKRAQSLATSQRR
jgi:beta-lactamase regulating signal transducer with metallopeptidase domain